MIAGLIDERPKIALDLERYAGSANPISLLRRTLVLSDDDVRVLVHDFPRRNSDEHLRLQYSAAWALGRFTLGENTFHLQAARRTLTLPLTRPATRNELLDPDHLVALLREGGRCRRSGRPDLAEALARMYLELDDEESRAHFLLAKSLEQLGRTTEAEAHFQRAGRLDPLANLERGRQLIERGKFTQAARTLERAVQAMPSSAKVHQYLPFAYSGLERESDARREISRAVELDPTFMPSALPEEKPPSLQDAERQSLGVLQNRSLKPPQIEEAIQPEQFVER